MREFGTTIFAEMSALAMRTGSINLGQGFPDTDGPAAMLETAVAAIRDGANQYPPGPGVPELRQAVAEHRKDRYGLDYDPDGEVLVTVGATEAVAATILALCESGDEVIAFEPYYDSYAACVALAGAVLRPVTLRPVEGRLHLRPRRTARRRQPAHPGDPGQLPAQSHRHGLHPRGAGGDRPSLPGARPDRRHRRGLRTPHLRRRRARPAGHPRRACATAP